MKDGMRILARLTPLLLVLILVVGCSDDDDSTSPPGDDTTQTTIGATGGVLDHHGDVALTVPAGALTGNIDFTADENTSPPAVPSDRALVSPVFDIGPDGTQFAVPATVTIDYDEADLAGADESGVLVYTNNGNGWMPLATTVDENANTATASVGHLSDFGLTIPYGSDADGVYATLEIMRMINDLGVMINRTDLITARFDTIVDPCNVHYALHPDSVYCDDYKLVWDGTFDSYIDDNLEPEFLDPGHEYTFEVFGTGKIPDLVQAIEFPSVEPYVTNLHHEQVVSREGFTVEWTGTGGGDLSLVLVTNNSEVEAYGIETANDGEYTFTATDLANLPAGVYALTMHHGNQAPILAEGYDPNSRVLAGTTNVTLINLADASGSIGPDGGVLPLGDDGYLRVPPGALSSVVDLTAVVNESPTAAPTGWEFVTPVYTIEPSGTTFAVDALLHFNYDEADLGENDESSMVIFTDTGSGWTQLTSSVAEPFDWVEADIDHLSDFVAMVEVDIPAEGVYCELLVRRVVVYYDPIVASSDDLIARFDAAVGSDPVTPLDVDGVIFNGWDLEWDSSDEHYDYVVISPNELTLGETYRWAIDGDDDVPDVVRNIPFIGYEPHVTNLSNSQTVSAAGFDVEWGGTGDGVVIITITDTSDEVIFATETENDGLYSIAAGDLDGAAYGYIGLDLGCVTSGAIDEAGYDPQSFWKTYSTNFTVLMLEE